MIMRLLNTFVLSCVFISNSALAGSDGLIKVVAEIEEKLSARIGMAVYDQETGKSWEYHANDRFPLSSTFKTIACAALLKKVEQGEENLGRRIVFAKEDLVTYSPITENHTAPKDMSLEDLCHATMTMSDNTAANLVLNSLGGPVAVTEFIRSVGDKTTRLDRIETELNEATPGDLRDTTTPKMMASAITKLILGDALSPASRSQLKEWMIANKVADSLIRASVPEDWVVADRTGAGGYGSRSITAVMWPPHRKPIIAIIYITETKAAFKDRNAAIAEIGTAIVNVLK